MVLSLPYDVHRLEYCEEIWSTGGLVMLPLPYDTHGLEYREGI